MMLLLGENKIVDYFFFDDENKIGRGGKEVSSERVICDSDEELAKRECADQGWHSDMLPALSEVRD